MSLETYISRDRALREIFSLIITTFPTLTSFSEVVIALRNEKGSYNINALIRLYVESDTLYL